jgi:hypothetical protein
MIRAAEKAVVRWQWATGPLYEAPLWAERVGLKSGRPLRSSPSPIRTGHRCYGFDAGERLRVERQYQPFAGEPERHASRLFFPVDGEGVIGARFSEHGELSFVFRERHENGRLVEIEQEAREAQAQNWVLTRFSYGKSGRVESVVEQVDRLHYPEADRAWTCRWTADWDASGRLATLARETTKSDGSSTRHVAFSKNVIEMPFASLAAQVERCLIAEIPKRVAALRSKKTAYCLALAYDDEGNDMLPPKLGVGREDERAAWRREHGKEARYYVWNPAEFSDYASRVPALRLQAKSTLDACRRLNQHVTAHGGASKVRTLLARVAGALNERSWERTLPVTPDFEVYAVDFELGRLPRSIGG